MLRSRLSQSIRVFHRMCIASIGTYLLTACHPSTLSDNYHSQYRHLQLQRKTLCKPELDWRSEPYFLVVLVDAKHLDYRGVKPLLRTISRHPIDGSRNCTVGHAWIILHGMKDGQPIWIEGGHSGEMGIKQPTYLEGVFQLAEVGPWEPNPEGITFPDPNPARYLFTSLDDGFFQKGSGNHKPSYAAMIKLNEQQFTKIYNYILREQYNFDRYSLRDNQCTDFAAKVALLAGVHLKHQIEVPIEPVISFEGKSIRLWQDPMYSSIVISSPDVLEKSLIEAVMINQAYPALKWYYRSYRNFFPE